MTAGRGCCGFTLIELMIVIAVMVALSVLAVPSIRAMVENFSVNRAAQTMVSDLNWARLLAIRTGRSSTVDFDVPAANQYTITWQENGVARTRVSDLTSYRGGVRFEPAPPGAATPAPVATITFTARGFTQANPQGWGDIYLTDRNNSKILQVETNFAGSIIERRWSAGGNTWMEK